MMKWILILLFFLNYSCTDQRLGNKHNLYCDSQFSIVIPPNSQDSLFNHEEGFFKTYFWLNGDILDIHCGSMNQVVYLNDSIRYEVLEFEDNGERKMFKGKEKTSGKVFGVMKFKKERVTISFFCAKHNADVFFKTLKDIRKMD